MCIVVIGGLKRLEPRYLREAGKMGIDLRIFNEPAKDMDGKLQHADAVIIFTNMVSHDAKRMAQKTARIQGIPVFMHHACGVCTLRECLNCLNIINTASHVAVAKSPVGMKLK